MSGFWPGSPKPQELPLLKEPGKKLEGQIDPVKPETSKGKQKQTYEQDQETTKSLDQAASTKSKKPKKGARHAARVESLLQEFLEEMSEPEDGEEEEDEDDPVNSDVDEGAERLPKKRSFQQSAISDSDHSDYGAGRSGRVEGNRKNIPYTGGQPSAKAASGGPRDSPARKSHSRSQTRAPEAGNKEPPKTSVEYLINKK